jgi:hypothetical protein
LGDLSWLLGLKVKHNQSEHTITLSQHAYVNIILKHFHLTDLKSAVIPMDAGSMLTVEQSPDTHATLADMQDVPYQRGIRSLMYAVTSTRPDIMFTIATLSQFMRNPGWAHWEAAKRTMRYLKGTAEYEIMLGGTDEGLEAYVDADWASQPHRHSMSGYVIMLHGGPVAWSSRKQPIIALSTAKSEYITLTAAAREVLYLQLLLKELYDETHTSTPIHCDNQSAIALVSNNKFHTHTKHIDIHYHFVRAHVKNSTFELRYCPTEDNIADTFTKPLPQPRFQKLRTMMTLGPAQGGVLKSEDSEVSDHM